MSRKDFNLRDIVNKAIDQATPTETLETVENVPTAKITPNARNFYGMRDLDDLAASIELTGLLHPIILRPAGAEGTYTIVDGERRFRAITEVLGWTSCPAIIRAQDPARTDAVNAILEELSLLEANRQNRKPNAAELSKEAERYKELLIELKENGVEIPGRLRDTLAMALDISASKLARLQKIRGSLVPEYLAIFDAGEMSESVAYAIAQLDANTQRIVVETESEAKKLAAYEIANRAEYLSACTRSRNCPYGGVCTWGVKMYDIGKNKSNYQKCTARTTGEAYPCCKNCSSAMECGSVCHMAQHDVDLAKQAKKAEEARKQELHAEECAVARRDWERVAKLREAAGIAKTDDRLPKADGNTWAEFENGLVPSEHYAHWTVARALMSLSRAIELADLFGVSLDDLVGRTVQPAPQEGPDDE